MIGIFTLNQRVIYTSMATRPKGFGKKSEGGMIADLPNDTILTESEDRPVSKSAP